MKVLIDRYGRTRVARVVFCALAVLLIAEGVIVYLAYTSIGYGAATLRLGSRNDTSITMTDLSGEVLTAEFRPPEEAPFINDFGFHCTISYLGKRIYRSLDLVNTYTFSDGSELDLTACPITARL